MHSEIPNQNSPIEDFLKRLLRVLTWTILGIYLAFGTFVATHIHNRLDPNGSPLGYDFSFFYVGASLAKAGHAADAYDDTAMFAAEIAEFPGNTTRLPWNYPPIFQLLLLPFTFLPYVPAWLAWSAVLYAGYALLARSLVPSQLRWLVLLCPGAAVNLLLGQNGLLTTGLIGGGMALLGRRPLVAGALFGLMAYKPHLAVLIPVLLLCGREWRALSAMVATGAGCVALSIAIFGAAPWLAFIERATHAPALFELSTSEWHTIDSVLVMALSLGLSGAAALALHCIVAAAASIAAMWVWWKSADRGLRAAALATATLIVTPYIRVYDLALLILPISVLATHGTRRLGLTEWAVLASAWVLPLVLLFEQPSIQVGPLVPIALMGLILRRVVRDSGALQLSRPDSQPQIPVPAAISD
jgi:alpha-1,2-mannosyltransferase